MQDSYITVPASYFYYLENQNALDILDDQSTPPPCFSMDEVIKFCQAKASLAVCKYEYYVLMTDFFKMTWGKALEQMDSIKPLKYSALKELPPPLASVDTLWLKGCFFWEYKISQRHTLWLGCAHGAHSTRFRLICAVERDAENWEDNKELRLDSKHWKQKLDEDGNHPLLETSELVLIEGQTTANVSLLRTIATLALKDILEFCTERAKM